jgi:uncharacterized protein YodC (DUF2158 family)
MNTILKGDYVILKSGGPIMRVNKVKNDIITVGWINDKGRQQTTKFNDKCLVKTINEDMRIKYA